jgi:tRNA 5-methylaminomethyl-2-thiouridine biosynthesis bifunctional protein
VAGGPRSPGDDAEALARTWAGAALHACGLPEMWRGAAAWRVLDCDFGTGAAFAATVAAWRADPARPRMLHYVGITDRVPPWDTLCAHLATHPALAALAQAMPTHHAGVMAGFQRFALFGGHLQWTLCIGAVANLLREQQFIADSVLLGAAELCTDRLQARPLARVCRQGTRLVMLHGKSHAARLAAMQPLGFQELPLSPAEPASAPFPTTASVPPSAPVAAGSSARALERDAAHVPARERESAKPGAVAVAGTGAGAGAERATVAALEYAPAWRLPPTRHAWRQPAREAADCVVLGAGLAGSAVASALALRGWQVTVLDAAPTPAGGASGLPAGLMAMPLTRDDAPRSRLARAGIRLTLQACRAHLVAGRDWQPCGALDLDAGHAARRLPAQWPAEAAAWSCTLDDARVPQAARNLAADAANAADAADAVCAADTAIWHAHAAWVRPATLVQAWLSQPGIRFAGGCTVREAWHDGTQWHVQDATGAVRASARHLVLCLAGASAPLLRRIVAWDANAAAASDAGPGAAPPAGACAGAHAGAHAMADPSAHADAHPGARAGTIVELAEMQSVAGTLSGGVHQQGDTSAFPTFAVQGAGHFKAHVPGDAGTLWWTGATFEPRAGQAATEASTPGAAGADAEALRAAHGFNLQRLRHLLPGVAQHLEARFASGDLRAWSGVRCATVDRLPAVGPLQDGLLPDLWTSTGMGARGLSYAALCAELLAAQMCSEPLPVEATLAQALRATRPRLRAATRAATPAT